MSVGTYFQFVLALVLVLALILLVAWAARRFGLAGRFAATGGKRRLALIEVLPLDPKRRLVLVRRDGTEHLVLLGLANDLVIERGIAAAAPPASFSAMLEGPGQ